MRDLNFRLCQNAMISEFVNPLSSTNINICYAGLEEIPGRWIDNDKFDILYS